MAVGIDTKECPKCGSFERYMYANKSRNKCGPCERARQAQYRADHPEKMRAQHRNWYMQNAERSHAYGRKWNQAHPESKREMGRRYRAAHPGHNRSWKKDSPEIGRAGRAVWRALRKGVLIRPSACSACAMECRPEAAHFDYSRPLDVRWLCQPCHRKWDRDEPKSAYSQTRKSQSA